MKKPRIVVVGSSNTDMIIRLPRLPKPGETLLGGGFLTAPGGKGANQAVGAARSGGCVTFIARVGRDALGAEAVRGFRREGIDVRFVARDPGSPSGVALIFVAKGGENSIAVAGGANNLLCRSDVRRARAAISRADVLLMQLETSHSTVAEAVAIAARCGVRTILNPAPARSLPASLLRRIGILTPNQTEAEVLTGIPARNVDGASAAAARLRAMGVGTVIVTLGAKGALVSDGACCEFVPGFKVRAVDTTAAGDVFNGALAVALGEGKPILEAVRFANAAAAISVTRMGAQPSAPTRAEVERFLRCGRL